MNIKPVRNAPLLQVECLRHQYGGRTVLAIEEWHLNRAENQLLLGPSGSGKTTLLAILSGLLRPTAGVVNALGTDLASLKSKQLATLRARTFGFVFQDHHLVSGLTVHENLQLARHLAKLPSDDAWTRYLLDHLGLGGHEKSKPRDLSHGEAQRAAIARAAATKPSLLLADEPTSALDDVNTKLVIELLTNLSEMAGSTMLVASHDLRLKPFFAKYLTLEEHQRAA